MDRKGQKLVKKVLADAGCEIDRRRPETPPTVAPEIPPKDKSDIAWATLWVRGERVAGALEALSQAGLIENLDNTNGHRDRSVPCLRVASKIDMLAAATRNEFPILVHDLNAAPAGRSNEIG